MNEESIQQLQILSTADYIGALDTLCGLTKHSLVIFEKDFVNIGFNNSARYEVLRSFLLSNPNNRLQLLAHDTKPISQYCPRLMTLSRQFAHNMFIYQTPKNLHHRTEAFAMADDTSFIRRFHFDHSKGIFAANEVGQSRLLKSLFTEMWQLSQASVWTGTFTL